ncbi:MAG: glycosyltransferase family 2 protein [Candidatus Sumerlaeales bacterium]|nr:glycosyltransferase family 2 protein [Candidatus Sumerlaeales bacterium]
MNGHTRQLPALAANCTISVIIPIYNEIELLPIVLEHLRVLPLNLELILVDDGSNDGTEQFLETQKHLPNCQVVRHSQNRGKGSAIVSGLKVATGDIIIIQDADMEYTPSDIVSVIEPIIDGKTNVCFGSRFLGKIDGMRLPNRIANYFLAFFVSALFGQRITDEATAYKAFRREIIKEIPLTCKGFEFCPEVTAKVLLTGEKILEIPVNYSARTFEEGKKIGYRDFFVAIKTMLKCRFLKNG